MTKEEVEKLMRDMDEWQFKGLTTANGLLYRNGVMVSLPDADYIAVDYGYGCAERLVKALEGRGFKEKVKAEEPIVARKVSNAIMEIGVNE